MNRARKRLRKSRHRRDRLEVRELAGLPRLENGTCGDRFTAGLRARHATRTRERRGRGTRRQLGEAEPCKPERRTRFPRDRAREIVRRATRRADDDQL